MSRDRDTFDMFKPAARGRFGDHEFADEKVTKVRMLDLDVLLHAETHPGKSEQGAVLVSQTGDERTAKWIPKSLCALADKARRVAGVNTQLKPVSLKLVTLTTEEWVAKEKGLV